MRIGSLQNISLQKWKPNDQRDLFVKSIPGYNMPLTFDLNSSMRTHVIDGTLVDTSNANLAADMEYLEALFRTGQLVWLDATDQYQALCAFGKIAKLQGPTVDASMGQYVAKFTLEFWSLPPWGVTMFNPWHEEGFKLRDIDGVGAEYALDPTQMNSNFTLNEIGQSTPYSVSWEFILENQNPFTNVTSSQKFACDSLTKAVNNPAGYGAAFGSISIDTSTYKEGIGSLKGNVASPLASTWYLMGYDLDSFGIDLSSYDRFRTWYMCDQSGQTTYRILMIDTSSRARYWNFSLQAASTWMNIVMNTNAYSGQTTGFDITHVRYLAAQVETSATAPSSLNLWIDDIRVEIGYLTHCEGTNFFALAGWSNATTTNDTVIYKNSYSGIGAPSIHSGVEAETSQLSSIKFASTTTPNSTPAFVYSFPGGSWDVSSYDFFMMWFRSDFGGSTSGSFSIYLQSGGTSNELEYTYSNLTANKWYRLVVPLNKPSSTVGTPSLSNVTSMEFVLGGWSSAATSIWIDEMAFDVGNWATLEMMIPDNILQEGTGNAIQVYSWNPSTSSYVLGMSINTFGTIQGPGCAQYYYLDGSGDHSNLYNAYTATIWPPGEIANTIAPAIKFDYLHNNLTYSSLYGTNSRMAIALKMPPATSDTLSANLPSNDLSGFQALNKIRIKVQLQITNDDTTYFGFNSL